MDAWCIITACGVSVFTVDTQAILQRESGLFRDRLCGGRVTKLAGLLKPWVKDVFMSLFKTQRFFMLDKYILKLAVIKDYESAFDAVEMFIQIP